MDISLGPTVPSSPAFARREIARDAAEGVARGGPPAQAVLSATGKAAGRRPGELSDEEKRQVEQLKKRDREVRAHEQAHLSAAGQYAIGGARYTYATGPDGTQYAVGGEVEIDTSEIRGDPEATARKMEQVRRAALAPLNPSPQDLRVAAEASQTEAKARAEASDKHAGESHRHEGGSPCPLCAAERYSTSATSASAGPLISVSA